MFTVKDVMSNELVTVFPETPIYDAVRLMVNKNVTGLPVVDEDMNLIGIISEKDVLCLLADDLSGSVADFMTTDVISFTESDDLIKVCESLVEHNFRRVPIVSGQKLVGLITRRDIIKYILEPVGK